MISKQFIKVYLVLQGIWNWMALPDFIVVTLKWWLLGGVIAFSIFVITQVVCLVSLIMFSGKKEKSALMTNYTEALCLINPSDADTPLQRSYLNFVPIILMGWVGVIYFFLFIFNKRYTQPEYKQKDVVIWRRYNYVINFMLIVVVVTYLLAMFIIE